MRRLAAALVIGVGLVAPAYAADPAASLPGTPAGRWTGTASEFQSPYHSTGAATITLDLRPDGTFTETWTQRGRERTESGRWRARGRDVVLEATEPARTRLRLRRSGDTLYAVAAGLLPAEGRVATEMIELRPAAR